jgi:hypothetical protein
MVKVLVLIKVHVLAPIQLFILDPIVSSVLLIDSIGQLALVGSTRPFVLPSLLSFGPILMIIGIHVALGWINANSGVKIVRPLERVTIMVVVTFWEDVNVYKIGEGFHVVHVLPVMLVLIKDVLV